MALEVKSKSPHRGLFAVKATVYFASTNMSFAGTSSPKTGFSVFSYAACIAPFWLIASIFSARGIPLEFFSITGMILVFGLGLDYVIYMVENEKRSDTSVNARLEPFAILLSFLTTAVSFGALALSSFVPVHMLGLSIFLGLTTAFLCTVL